MNNIKESYNEVFLLLNKHKDLLAFNIEDLEKKRDAHLFGIELKEKYGLNIDPKKVNSTSKVRILDYSTNSSSEYITIKKDSKNVLFLHIEFYDKLCFNNQRITKHLFDKLLEDLKKLNPVSFYSFGNSGRNVGFKWKIDNAKGVLIEFSKLLKKYFSLSKN